MKRRETLTKTERIALGNPKAQYGAFGLIIAKNTLEKLVSSVPKTKHSAYISHTNIEDPSAHTDDVQHIYSPNDDGDNPITDDAGHKHG